MTVKNESEVIEQLGHLKDLTKRTGILFEPQILQLQIWPLVVFPKALTTNAEVDVENHLIKFNIEVPELYLQSKVNKGRELLEVWVRRILWDNTTISLNFKEVKNETGRKRRKNTKRVH